MKSATILATILLVSGCSQSDVPQDAAPKEAAAPGGGDSQAAKAPAAGDAASSAMTQLPDACEIFTASDAAEVLGAPAERYEPRVECAYLEQGVGKGKSKQVSAAVFCPALQERHYEGLSQEQLIERLRLDMMGGEFRKVDASIGRGAYIFTQPSGVIVFVPTGVQYRDQRGPGGELAVQTTTMKFGDDAAGIKAAVDAARTIMGKLEAAQ